MTDDGQAIPRIQEAIDEAASLPARPIDDLGQWEQQSTVEEQEARKRMEQHMAAEGVHHGSNVIVPPVKWLWEW